MLPVHFFRSLRAICFLRCFRRSSRLGPDVTPLPVLVLVVVWVLLASAAPLPATTWGAVRRITTITDARICEASGITPSLRQPGLVWINNDSGDSARIFAVRLADGVILAEVAVANAGAVDWECIHSGPGPEPGVPCLYIGDVGNNSCARTDLRVYRIPEPDLSGVTPGQKLTSAKAAKLRFSYPDGNFDCEGIAVHPVTGEIYLFTKKGAPSGVYRLSTLVDDGVPHPAERVGTLSVANVITDAAFSSDGLRIAIRTYAAVYEMTAALPDDPISAFLAKGPAQAPTPPEGQGEAVCWAADVSGLMTVSEGTSVPIYSIPMVAVVKQPYCEVASEEQGDAGGSAPVFLRGDANDDDLVDISDVHRLLRSLFSDGHAFGCDDAADSNDDGEVDNSDTVTILLWLFAAVEPDSSVGLRGEDVTPDEIGCTSRAPEPPPAGEEPKDVTLVPLGALWRYRLAPDAPPASWKDPGFDDSAWLEGPTGIGYGDGDDATVVAMSGSCMTIHARMTFDVADPAKVEALRVEIDYDDGFVAYLNGVEVARRGVGQLGIVPAFDEASTLREAGAVETIPVCCGPLSAGRNILAFEVHNAALTSTDLSFEPALVAQVLP